MSRNSPVVAIVGRPNVGKSTLFNRLIKKRRAIVHSEAGITRDRISEIVTWGGNRFVLVDTGGYSTDENVISKAIRKQVEFAVNEADLILFIVDVKSGIVSEDREVASLLRKSGKEVILVVNKVDNEKLQNDVVEFYELGFDEPVLISALHGLNTGDLLDLIIKKLPFVTADKEVDENKIKLTIVGMPNVGKSSILNALLGKEVSIITEIPGTTRDTVDTTVKYYGNEIVLIDTAGLRKKSAVKSDIEFYSAIRTIQAIERCDIAAVVIDAVKGMGVNDINIIRKVIEKGKGMMIIVNKWDLIEKKHDTMDIYKKNLISRLNILKDYPILFTSAITKKRIFQIYPTALQIYENLTRRIPTSKLNDSILQIIKAMPPPSYKGKFIHIKYVTQIKQAPPVFVFFCNEPRGIKENYRKFLENKIREICDFMGVPIKLLFRGK